MFHTVSDETFRVLFGAYSHKENLKNRSFWRHLATIPSVANTLETVLSQSLPLRRLMSLSAHVT